MVRGIESAKTKLARAAKHLKAIKRSITEYSHSEPHKIIRARTNGTKERKLTIPTKPRREISVLAGEMVYQMRSALDHLAFDLVQRNPSRIQLGAHWFRRCEFPLCVDLPTKGNPPIPYKPPVPQSVFAKKLPGISAQAFAFIERLQPYYGTGEINNSLRYLAELSNIDKHRYLNFLAASVEQRYAVRFASGISMKGYSVLHQGAKLPSFTGGNQVDRPLSVHRRFRMRVEFNERAALGDACALPVDYLLEFILKQIKAVIIPAFEKLI